MTNFQKEKDANESYVWFDLRHNKIFYDIYLGSKVKEI